MTTRAEIIGSGPGTATIRVLGNEIRPPIEAFQIQRNQMPDAYLHRRRLADLARPMDRPQPRRCFGSRGRLPFIIGPALVDPIVYRPDAQHVPPVPARRRQDLPRSH